MSAAARVALPADVTALGRVEGRELLRHPVFLVGALLSVALLYAGWHGIFFDARSRAILLSGHGVLPLAAATAIAANLGALRSRRDGTEELYRALPRSRVSRVGGQLVGLLWTLPVSAVLIAGAYLAYGASDWDVGSGLLVELAQGPLVVVALGALGILVARIAPSAVLVPLLIVAGFFAGLELTYWLVGVDVPRSPAWVHWLAPLANPITETFAPASCPPHITHSCFAFIIHHDTSGLTWHLGYILALVAFAGAAALARTRRRAIGLVAMIPVLAIASALAAG